MKREGAVVYAWTTAPGFGNPPGLRWPRHLDLEEEIARARHPLVRALAATGLALLGALPARAQTPAPDPPPAPAPDLWKMGLEFSYTDQSGNKTLRLMQAGLKFSRRAPGALDLDGTLQSRYGQSDGEVVARNHFASFTFAPSSADRWAPSLSLKAERDRFKRLDARLSSGAGVRYTPVRSRERGDEVSLSAQLSYEYTNLRGADLADEPEEQHLARWTAALKAARRIREGVTAHHQSSFEPAWSELADYLLRAQTGLRVVLSEKLSLLVEYQLERTNRPPEGVEPDDRLFRTGITIAL